MRTFIFTQKNGNATITLSAENYEEALKGIVLQPKMWRVEDEEGEDE
jgi:hypothetical protein